MNKSIKQEIIKILNKKENQEMINEIKKIDNNIKEITNVRNFAHKYCDEILTGTELDYQIIDLLMHKMAEISKKGINETM